MIQRHSIILWKNAYEKSKSFEDIAKESFELLKLLQKYPVNFQPIYLSEKIKKESVLFDWNFNNFKLLLEKSVNKEGQTVFYDLGYTLSFFSSFDDEESCSIKITTGITNANFVNSFILDLPIGFDLYNKVNADLIRNLFRSLINIYTPFFGCVSNKVLTRKYGAHLKNDKPAIVHWLNYWSESIVEKIDNKKIKSVLQENEQITFSNGVFSIKETALDMNNEKDLEYQEYLQKELL